MLTPRQFEILSYLHSCPDQTALHSALADRFDPDGMQRVAHLISLGLVDRSPYYDTVRLTPGGLDAMDEYQSALDNARQQRAEEKAEKAAEKEEDRAYTAKQNRKSRHHDYFVAAFNALLTFVLGIIAEHKLNIAAFVVELFEEIASLFH